MQSDSQRRATAKWQAENMTNVAARVRREVAEEFKAAAKEDGTTPNELLRGWIGEYINKEVTTMTTDGQGNGRYRPRNRRAVRQNRHRYVYGQL